MRSSSAFGAFAASFLLAACSASAAPGGTDDVMVPPEVIVRGDGTELRLKAWTACWEGGCYDGFAPTSLADAGSPDEILVEFPVPRWEFSATVRPFDDECGRRQTEPLETLDDTHYRLTPVGYAGDYTVTLFGHGPGGDVFVSFRWHSPKDGVLPVPAASVAVLSLHDGVVDTYGAEVTVWNLASTPEEASGEITVTSAEGRSHTIALTQREVRCGVGLVSLTAEPKESAPAAALGSPPFTYSLTLHFDGAAYSAAAVWPDDVDPGDETYIYPAFDPPLPTVGGG